MAKKKKSGKMISMSENHSRKKLMAGVRRVVVKIGSGVLTHHRDIIDLEVIDSLADGMSRLVDDGKEVIVVTSGAVAAGVKKLGLKGRPRNIPEKQAAAAAGQSTLIHYYEQAFEKRGKKVAQMLLTGDGLSDRRRYLNARNTLSSLLHYNVIPVINENDTVAVDEIRFGDNDNLSAMVAGLSDSDLLVVLTDTEGLYDKDPRSYKDANLISTVTDFESQTRGAVGSSSDTGTGGMTTKVEAARKAASFGVATIIANGEKAGILSEISMGKNVGTLFVPGEGRLKGRKRWLASSLKVCGELTVDSGAMAALKAGKSLLPSGLVSVKGKFGFGDLVSVFEVGGGEFARGLVLFASSDLELMKGKKSSEIEEALGKKDYDEIIHCDDLVLT